MSKIRRISKYRTAAATRRAIRRHAACWNGVAAKFPGFGLAGKG